MGLSSAELAQKVVKSLDKAIQMRVGSEYIYYTSVGVGYVRSKPYRAFYRIHIAYMEYPRQKSEKVILMNAFCFNY